MDAILQNNLSGSETNNFQKEFKQIREVKIFAATSNQKHLAEFMESCMNTTITIQFQMVYPNALQ